MNSLFIANVELNPNEGICKKIFSQAIGLKNANEKGWLLTKCKEGSSVHNLQENRTIKSHKGVIKEARKIIENNYIDIVYIRHMIPSVGLIRLLRWMNKCGVTILYEIPTYPYYAEQFRTSKHKYRAVIKLTLDTIFWPFIYHYITHLVVIKSNSKVHMFKKMIEITNGADIDNIKEKSYREKDTSRLSMVTFGTLYPYHGYDRILKGLKLYNADDNRTKVEFHVIGISETINDLKKQAEELEISNVFFHGVKNTQELNTMCENYDIGIGAVALHRRNANIDTTIKVIEYYCRGLVVATSGDSPMDQYDKSVTIHVPNDESPIDIGKIVECYHRIPLETKKNIAKQARIVFSWNNIMKKLCDVGKLYETK